MTLLRLSALALTALILVPSGAHLIEMPNKFALDRDAYFAVQQIYAGWAFFAVPILAAVVANGALFIAERRLSTSAARAALIASILIILSNVVFFIWMFPANQATANWTQMPETWQPLRRQWEYGHAVIAVIVFVALLMTGWALVEGHREQNRRETG
jgi:hypothetical protein